MTEAWLDDEALYIVRIEDDYGVGSIAYEGRNKLRVSAMDRVRHLEDAHLELSEDCDQLVCTTDELVVHFRLLTPESYAEMFPDQVRTFKDQESIQAYFSIRMRNYYKVQSMGEYTYFVVVSGGEKGERRVLELRRRSVDGVRQLRKTGGWVQCAADGEHPTAPSTVTLFIDEEDAQSAVNAFDSKAGSGEVLVESEISGYLSLV